MFVEGSEIGGVGLFDYELLGLGAKTFGLLDFEGVFEDEIEDVLVGSLLFHVFVERVVLGCADGYSYFVFVLFLCFVLVRSFYLGVIAVVNRTHLSLMLLRHQFKRMFYFVYVVVELFPSGFSHSL